VARDARAGTGWGIGPGSALGGCPGQTSTPSVRRMSQSVRQLDSCVAQFESRNTARTTSWQLRAALWLWLGAPGGV
jgi:hypothetical protein